MLNANLASYPYVSPTPSYTENLGRAARDFIAALLAVDPANFSASRAKHGYAESDPAEIHAELDRLARKFDPIMPSQAAELRYLLSRE